MKKSLSIFLITAVVLVSGVTFSAQARPLGDTVPTATPNPHVKQPPQPRTLGSPSAHSGITDVSSQAVCSNLAADPGFEAGTPNPSWTEYSSNSGTPLCDAGCGGFGPRSGSEWAWFGGVFTITEMASLTQTVTIPTDTARLSFYLAISYNSGGGADDLFTAGIDSTPVFTATSLDMGYYPTYKQVTVDVSAFATGSAHELSFKAVTSNGLVSFDLDDVSLCSFVTASKAYLPLVGKNNPKSLTNGGFESGATGWLQFSAHGYPIILPTAGLPAPPHSGGYAAWLGGDDDENSYVEQSVTIPASTPYLGYWHWINSGESSCIFDFAYVRVNGIVVNQYGLCSASNTGGWVKKTVNLSAYVGQSVFLQIMVQTDVTVPSDLLVDDVGLKSTAAWGPETGSANPISAPWISQSRTGEEQLPANSKPEWP